jgi:hypothetical protein
MRCQVDHNAVEDVEPFGGCSSFWARTAQVDINPNASAKPSGRSLVWMRFDMFETRGADRGKRLHDAVAAQAVVRVTGGAVAVAG